LGIIRLLAAYWPILSSVTVFQFRGAPLEKIAGSGRYGLMVRVGVKPKGA
jgi:hypothetical protein